MQISKVVTLLAVAAFQVGFSFADQPRYSGMATSCTGCFLQSPGHTMTVTCSCVDSLGGQHSTTLDLNNCFANRGGLVVYALGGNLIDSCSYFALSGDQKTYQNFRADCSTGRPNTPLAVNRVNLNDYVGNFQGELAC